jgi:hypothetical protein
MMEMVAPDCFSWRELPEDGDTRSFIREMFDVWADQVEHGRLTIVSDEYPNPPYSNGLYFEGWSKAPENYDPPRQAAPFDYPLVAVE